MSGTDFQAKQRQSSAIRDWLTIGLMLAVVGIVYTIAYLAGKHSEATRASPNSESFAAASLDGDISQLVAIGNQLMDSGRHDEAISHYSRALLADSSLVDVIVDRGSCYFALARYQEAIADFSSAILLDPEHAVAYFNLGVVYSRLGYDSAAVANWQRCVELQPETALADRVRTLLEERGQ